MRLQGTAFFALATSLALASCFGNPDPSRPALSAGALSLPVPTKDEILIVDGRRLSLTGYYALKERFPHLNRESLLWLATSSLALQNLAQSAGHALTPEKSAQLAHLALSGAETPVLPAELENEARALLPGEGVAISPVSLRAALDRIVARAVVQRNAQVLAELH